MQQILLLFANSHGLVLKSLSGKIIVPSTKFELVRWIACLADRQKSRYFVQIDNIGAAGSRYTPTN